MYRCSICGVMVHQANLKISLLLLPLLCYRKNISLTIQWHFFATSHGKGCVDGVGGLVKPKVAERVKQRKASVQEAHSVILQMLCRKFKCIGEIFLCKLLRN